MNIPEGTNHPEDCSLRDWPAWPAHTKGFPSLSYFQFLILVLILLLWSAFSSLPSFSSSSSSYFLLVFLVHPFTLFFLLLFLTFAPLVFLLFLIISSIITTSYFSPIFIITIITSLNIIQFIVFVITRLGDWTSATMVVWLDWIKLKLLKNTEKRRSIKNQKSLSQMWLFSRWWKIEYFSHVQNIIWIQVWETSMRIFRCKSGGGLLTSHLRIWLRIILTMLTLPRMNGKYNRDIMKTNCEE